LGFPTVSRDDEILRVESIVLEVLTMKAKWKWLLWITGALLLAIVASVVYIENRGGHYPVYKASSFSNLAPPAANMASAGEPVVQIGARFEAYLTRARR
jgi:hypothetical protein